MFELLIVQPLLNILMFFYAVLPGHNFGLAIIVMTFFLRFAMHPLIKKQLHHTKAMRELQPEIDKIKKATKGDSQETARLTMELYKEKEIKPLASLFTIAAQVIVLIGLYAGLRQISDDPSVILDKTYRFIANLGSINELSANINAFDSSLFGLVDLTRAASGEMGFYLGAFILVIGSAVSQYFMGKQLLPNDKDKASLRKILKNSKTKKPEQSEIQSILSDSLKYLIPVFIFLFTYTLPSALALYWLATGVVGYYQQRHILKQDEVELVN